MHISRQRNFQFFANSPENLATFSRTDSAKRTHRRPVRFVVGRFENKIDIFRRADFGDASRHLPNKLLRLNHARTENEDGTFSPNRHFAYAERFRHTSKESRNAGILKSSLHPAPNRCSSDRVPLSSANGLLARIPIQCRHCYSYWCFVWEC